MAHSAPPGPDPDLLLRRWRERGDGAALGALFDATAPELFAVALHLCRDPALAEDALQETYLAALESLDRFDGERRVVPWLAGILRNKVHEVRRFEERAPDPRRVPLPPDPDGPLAAAATTEEEARVRAALEALEEPYREVALLRWRHGLEPAEIAAVKKTAPGTVRSLLHRAAEKLRRDLAAPPALLLLIGEGVRPPRGLPVVRAEVLRRAPVPLVPAVPPVVLLGGALMAKKALVAGAALLALVGLGWFALREEGREPAPSNVAATAERPPAPGVEVHQPVAEEAPALPDAPAPVTGPKITGRVIDREGRPVPGARVACYPDTMASTLLPTELGTEGRPGAAALAAADGRFEVAASPDAPFHGVIASAAGFADALLPQVRAGEDVVVTVDRPYALVGRVTDMDGVPIPKARVRVLHLVETLRIEREGLTGADGAYRVEGLVPPPKAAGVYLVTQLLVEVAADGYAPLLIERGIQGKQEPGGTATLDAILNRGSSLAGKVLDGESGEPVAGARVVLWSVEGMMSFGRAGGTSVSSPWGPRPLQEGTSGPDGSFRFDGVPALGPHATASHNMGQDGKQTLGHVGAWKEGYCGMSLEVPLVAEGKVTERELRLPPAAAVHGRVVDEAGKPLAGLRVWTIREGAPRTGWFPEFYAGVPLGWAKTAGDGSYRIAGIPAVRGGPVAVTVAGQRRNPGENWGGEDGKVEVSVGAGEDAAAPDLVLGPGDRARLDILVTDEGGSPVWGATVAQAAEFGGGGTRTDAAGRASLGFMTHFVGRSGERTERPLIAVNLVARAPGFGPGTATGTPSATEPVEVRITLPAAQVLTGRVVESDGSPSRGATVTVMNGSLPVEDVFPEGGPRARPRVDPRAQPLLSYGYASTDEDGRFTVKDLPPGPYHLQAYRYLRVGGGPQGGFMAPRMLRTVLPGVATGAGEIVLTLPVDDSPPAGILEGTVVDGGTGKPVWTFFAAAWRGTESVSGGQPTGGRFRIEGVPEGEWTVKVTAPGFAPFTLAGVAVAAGEGPRKVEVKLLRGTTVVGKVRESGGAALADLVAILQPTAGSDGFSASATAPLEADGSFRATGLTPGTWRLSVSGGGFGANQKNYIPVDGGAVEIPEGAEEVRVEAIVAAAGILTVGVRDPRFPPNPYEGGKATEEQAALGAASRMELRDGSGKVVREGKGVAQGYVGLLGYVPLLPGEYVVRLESPGAEPREERVRVEAGQRATVTFKGE